MLRTRVLVLELACLSLGLGVASCTETAAAPPRGRDGDAPALLPNRSAPPPFDGVADDGSLTPRQDTASAPERRAEEPSAAPIAADAGVPADGGLSTEVPGDGATETTDPTSTDAPGTAAEEDTKGVGESNFPTPITPSAGCAEDNPAPPQGIAGLMIRDLPAEYLVTLPEGYDGTTPLPLVFGFHGRARTFLDFAEIDATLIQSELGSRAIMVYPQAQGGEGWTNEEELPPSIEFWNALYRQMLTQYCVDTTHVFAVGHSSGGFFSHILGCRYGERLRGIGVVAGTLPENDCSGYVAALMIHGVRDSVVATSRGESARDHWLTRNGCTPDTQPGLDEHCVDYQGCEPGLPITWCEHDEPTYDDTNHGWPSFASHAIGEFLFSLP